MNTEDLIKQLDDKKLLDLLYGYAYMCRRYLDGC